ncbi:UDP-N-acetylmuramoyl-L-alanyl-D-glutamate--2,6-diaminopimelate ligase [Desulfurivibrio sp. C05AmB]|uniref:UDP-N-acetylmuramoyl-L-alanyl-D-glutamate--2, 6-diaminopimelate ligase n=1 Tax=Desulfurivibrio sp. C05AmB TaxID=3374371 RepID=UPI00376F05BB
MRQLLETAGVDWTVMGRRDHPDPVVTAVTADSRRAGPAALFVALPGTRVDGHDYVTDALARGCRAVLTSRGRAAETARMAAGQDFLHLASEDPREAFGRLCAALQGQPAAEMVMIGITGTNGKTTSTYLLEELIRRSGGEPGVIGTVNYRYRERSLPASHTTPEAETLQRLLREMAGAGVTHVIMEVSSHALEQRRVAGILFDVALFTNLSHEHLDYHGDMERYYAGKKRLFYEHLKPGGAAVIVAAAEDEGGPAAGTWARRLAAELLPLSRPAGSPKSRRRAESLRLIRCGFTDGELRVAARRSSLAGVEARLQGPGGAWTLQSSLVGGFNLDNLLGVAGVGLALGLSPEQIRTGLAAAAPPPGRLERFTSSRGLDVFVDYAHTPDALAHVLQALRPLTPGRLIVLFGCGGDRDRAKRPLMGAIAARGADIVVVTSDNPRSEEPAAIMAAIERGLLEGGARRGRLESLLRSPAGLRGYDLVESRRRAIRDTIFFARPGDVVLVCGKGHETTQVVAGVSRFFDDRLEVREQLAILGQAR